MPGTGLRLVPAALQSSCLAPLALYQVVNAWLGTHVYLLWTTGLCLRAAVVQWLLDRVWWIFDNQAGQRAQAKGKQHWGPKRRTMSGPE